MLMFTGQREVLYLNGLNSKFRLGVLITLVKIMKFDC